MVANDTRAGRFIIRSWRLNPCHMRVWIQVMGDARTPYQLLAGWRSNVFSPCCCPEFSITFEMTRSRHYTGRQHSDVRPANWLKSGGCSSTGQRRPPWDINTRHLSTIWTTHTNSAGIIARILQFAQSGRISLLFIDMSMKITVAAFTGRR